MKQLLFLLISMLLFSTIVSAAHTRNYQLHEQQHKNALLVQQALQQEYEKVYSGCFNYPYGPCPYERVYNYIPHYGYDYPQYQHWLQYHRPIAYLVP